MSGAIDLSDRLSTFSEHWSPRTVTQFNNCDVMVVNTPNTGNAATAARAGRRDSPPM